MHDLRETFANASNEKFEHVSLPASSLRQELKLAASALVAAAMLDAVVNTDAAELGSKVVSVTPKGSTNLFANPENGWMTSDRPRRFDNPFERHSTGSYQKYQWSELQKGPEDFDFSKIHKDLRNAEAVGQSLHIRVIPYEPRTDAPGFIAGVEASYIDDPKPFKLVDMNGVALKHYLRLIEALGKEFNNDPRLTRVDCPVYGIFGEDHIGQVVAKGTIATRSSQREFAAKYEPTEETVNAILDAYRRAFPDKELFVQMVNRDVLAKGIAMGLGLRYDCVTGDYAEKQVSLKMGELSASNRRNGQPVATNHWQLHPVDGESCGSLKDWAKYPPEKLRAVLEHAAEVRHLSTITARYGNTNGVIAPHMIPELHRFMMKIGYRFEVSKVEHQREVKKGEPLELTVIFNNVGVAPLYNKNYVVAVQLQDPKTSKELSTHVLDETLALKLPGQFGMTLKVPTTAVSGEVQIALGVLDRRQKDQQPDLRLAVDQETRGWHPVSRVHIR